MPEVLVPQAYSLLRNSRMVYQMMEANLHSNYRFFLSHFESSFVADQELKCWFNFL